MCDPVAGGSACNRKQRCSERVQSPFCCPFCYSCRHSGPSPDFRASRLSALGNEAASDAALTADAQSSSLQNRPATYSLIAPKSEQFDLQISGLFGFTGPGSNQLQPLTVIGGSINPGEKSSRGPRISTSTVRCLEDGDCASATEHLGSRSLRWPRRDPAILATPLKTGYHLAIAGGLVDWPDFAVPQGLSSASWPRIVCTRRAAVREARLQFLPLAISHLADGECTASVRIGARRIVSAESGAWLNSGHHHST